VSAAFEAEVAVVGGGPAGAAIAAHLASAGRNVVVLERLARPVWRACGVYTSPLTRRRLASLGLPADDLERLIRPIPAMNVETADGRACCRLEYPAPHSACGVDRVHLEQALLDLIRARGVRVFEGAVVRSVELLAQGARLTVSQADGVSTWNARVVVGADGPTSVVARAARVSRTTPWFRRGALTGHRALAFDDARMIIGDGWYIGIAPVPSDRVNLGLVMDESALRRRLSHSRPSEVVDEVVRSLAGADGLVDAPPTDEVAAHLPLAHRVRRVSGDGFVLVGDAAGFVDPLSGEGLHRALVSADLAADAIDLHLGGDRLALGEYDRRLRARFRSKDVLSWALQLFMLRPALAFGAIRRLDQRPDMRRAFGAALADLAPASTVLDPRFVARLLA
jgi:flavin-dependent dehydrogenase